MLRAVGAALVLILAGAAVPMTAPLVRPSGEVRPVAYQPVILPYQLPGAPVAPVFDPAESVYAVDTTTMTPLLSQNADQSRPIASITKVMTVLTVLQHHAIDENINIGRLPPYTAEDEVMGLTDGERFRLGDLVKAALIGSDNDAADALAIYAGGTQAAFIDQMNAQATSWHLDGAHFNSTSGLVDDHNAASAVVLAKLGKLALTNPVIAQTVAMPSATIGDTAGRVFNLKTTDSLLANGTFHGIKTGYTGAAGQCFLGLTQIHGHDIITVVLGSNDRFGDTQRLVSWINGAWQWQ